MGCDIHLHIEIKVAGVWHHLSAPRITRNYLLFGKMAGVRGTETPLKFTKGLPHDVTSTTMVCYKFEQSDAHDIAMLDWDEIRKLVKWYEEKKFDDIWGIEGQFGFICGYGIADPPDFVEDIRLVFWFDN